MAAVVRGEERTTELSGARDSEQKNSIAMRGRLPMARHCVRMGTLLERVMKSLESRLMRQGRFNFHFLNKGTATSAQKKLVFGTVIEPKHP